MSIIIKTDVTAVKLIGKEILSGIGSYIHLFSKETGKILQRIRALDSQKIYGFSLYCHNNEVQKILVFGGKQFSIASWDSEKELKLSIVCDAIVCDDWINCGVWFSEESESDVVAVLTAHNVVQKWNINTQSIISTHASVENSILYSGLLVPLNDDLLVLAGTVYSEVLIRMYRDETAFLRLKGHRGVILSLACNLQSGLIVTTSDDRSMRIWGSNYDQKCLNYDTNTKLYWENVQMDCKHEVYGHTARVMRCALNDHIIASIGEDSNVCIWTPEGKLIEKKSAHQNGSIWSIDVDTCNNIVTGGGDGGIILHPNTSINYNKEINTLNTKIDSPKKILYTARNNIVVLTKDEIIYYDEDLHMVTAKFNIKFESTYILMDISSCKQLISVCDMLGNFNIFMENCKGEPLIKNIVETKLEMGKILSMQWVGPRDIILCCNEGNIHLLSANGTEIDIEASFMLPNCKERWLTSCAFNSSKRLLIVGDRCGNIHFYLKGIKKPLQTFNKVHGAYGPTSLKVNNTEIISTGRDGTAKYFTFNESDNTVTYMTAKDLTFEWVERHIYRSSKYICGFRERVFVVYDLVNNAEVLEVPCGGGHRPWDAVKYIEKTAKGFKEYIKIVFLKSPEIYQIKYNLEEIVPRHIIQGTHTKELNCLYTMLICIDPETKTVINFSGGEDTTLRASMFSSIPGSYATEFAKNSDGIFKQNLARIGYGNFQLNVGNITEEILHKHLSNIRALKIYSITDEKHLLVSAGGRAQICVNIIWFLHWGPQFKIEQLTNYMIKGTDKQRKGTKSWKEHAIDFDPETRIMDLDIKEINENIYHIFAGCSDGYLRIFELTIQTNNKENFKLISEIKYHETCILKVHIIENDQKDILVTCTTRGVVAFWDTNNLNNNSDIDKKPFFETQCNKSGINSIDSKHISENRAIIATGGDDNAMHLNEVLFNKTDESKSKVLSEIIMNNWHSSQITGVKFVDCGLLLSTSIDQRVTLCRWWIEEHELKCKFLRQYISDVADIHGMNIVDESEYSIQVCVYGKGYEVISVYKTTSWREEAP